MIKASHERISEEDKGFSQFIIEDLDVVPEYLSSKACPKSFSDGFFGSKAACKVGDGILEFVAVILLSLREEAIEKVETVALDAGAHSSDFDDVVAKASCHGYFSSESSE
jgi:hypothetical protein